MEAVIAPAKFLVWPTCGAKCGTRKRAGDEVVPKSLIFEGDKNGRVYSRRLTGRLLAGSSHHTLCNKPLRFGKPPTIDSSAHDNWRRRGDTRLDDDDKV